MATYLPLFLLFTVAGLLALGLFAAATLLGPKNPSAEKEAPFECGNPSEGARKLRPSVKFYLTALLFVVFDIEAVMIYPWAVEFRSLGWTGFLSMASFIGLLAIVLIYVWKKGALEWEK
jgi:NADH-quinone oxidoreductase subunit A